MAENALHVKMRETAGKGTARKLRAAGRIPGVCYGRSIDPMAVHLDPRALEQLLARGDAGMNTLFDLKVEGGGDYDGKPVLVKDLQRDPVHGVPLHADLYAVDLQKKITVSVPLQLTGTAEGVSMEAGILDHSLRELELECLPTAIPKEIRVDVSALGLGDSLHVRDVALPEGVTLLSDLNLSIVSVVAPAAIEEEKAVEEGAEVEGEAPVEGEAAEAEAPAEKPAEESSGE